MINSLFPCALRVEVKRAFKFELFALLFLLAGCAAKVAMPASEGFSQKKFIVSESGQKSLIFVKNASGIYHFAWFDMKSVPIARKALKSEPCDEFGVCAKFENEGFFPPNSHAEKLFLQILENAHRFKFELNVDGRRYEVENAPIS